MAFVACKKDNSSSSGSGGNDNNNGIVYYDANNIEGVTKIKELLVDADCDKGISSSGTITSTYGTNPFSDIIYCDGWNVDATTVDEFYRNSGKVSSAEYHRSKQMAIIVFTGTGVYGGYGSYWRGEYENTVSFYTKNSH